MFKRFGGFVFLRLFGDSSEKSTDSGLILGKQGKGKSSLSKKIGTQYIQKGVKCFVIDPHSEWDDISKTYGGRHYTLGEFGFNVLELYGMSLPLKISMLAEIFEGILGRDPSGAQYVAIRQTLKRTYAKFGLGIDNPKTWNKKCPTLKDVYYDIQEQVNKLKGVKKVTHEVILEALEDYAVGIFSNSLCENTIKIDWNNPLNVFDISKVDPTARKLLMLSIMSRIYSEMKRDLTPKILVIDEGWRMLQNEHVARHVGEFMKEGRKYLTSLILIIHHLGDLKKIQEIADEIKRGMGWKAIFHLEESARNEIKREFGLSEKQIEFIRDAEVGEFLLITEEGGKFCKVILSGSREKFDMDTEYWQFTTDPIDVELREKKIGEIKQKKFTKPKFEKKEKGHTYSNFKELKDLIKPSGVEEKQELESKGFKPVRVHQISGYGTEIYYVHDSVKNPAHDVGVYQLAEIISNYRKCGDEDILIHYNYGCDIEFKHVQKRIAVEYANSVASSRELVRKVELEKEVGEENYFLVVSNEQLKKRYQGFKNLFLRKDFLEYFS